MACEINSSMLDAPGVPFAKPGGPILTRYVPEEVGSIDPSAACKIQNE